MNKVLSFLAILMLVLLCACKSNAVTPAKKLTNYAKEYKVKSFNAVEVNNSIDVRFSQSSETKIIVTATEQALSYLKVQVSGGKLSMYFDTPIGFRGRLKASVVMSSPTLKAVTAFNSSDFEVVTPFKGETLKIEAYNSADIEFKNSVEVKTLTIGAFNSADVDIPVLKATTVNCEVFNSADVELGGNTGTVSFEAYNTGEIDAARLFAKSGKASAFNAGTIKCNVPELKSEKFNGGKIKNVH